MYSMLDFVYFVSSCIYRLMHRSMCIVENGHDKMLFPIGRLFVYSLDIK